MNIINNKYKLIEKIGEGSFGLIYKGQNIRTNEYVAVKVEPIKHQLKLLKNESNIYQYLNGCINIPSVKWFGKDEINYYMVINLLGESLDNLKKRTGTFSLRLILKIGIKVIFLLKMIHDKGLIHRDIKPDNFLFSLNNKKDIYLIDFGFCKPYLKDGKHIALKTTSNIIGSKTYTSVNSHNFMELSRRDDLESLGYMLIYFYLERLPWHSIQINDVIKEKKANIFNDILLPKIMVDYMMYIKSLEFEGTPNYNLLIDIFKREITEIG